MIEFINLLRWAKTKILAAPNLTIACSILRSGVAKLRRVSPLGRSAARISAQPSMIKTGEIPVVDAFSNRKKKLIGPVAVSGNSTRLIVQKRQFVGIAQVGHEENFSDDCKSKLVCDDFTDNEALVSKAIIKFSSMTVCWFGAAWCPVESL